VGSCCLIFCYLFRRNCLAFQNTWVHSRYWLGTKHSRAPEFTFSTSGIRHVTLCTISAFSYEWGHGQIVITQHDTYCATVNQVMVGTVKLPKWWLQHNHYESVMYLAFQNTWVHSRYWLGTKHSRAPEFTPIFTGWLAKQHEPTKYRGELRCSGMLTTQ
jgi:hypothetical protein